MHIPALAATFSGKYSVIEAELPGQDTVALGILLEDPDRNRLHVRLRRDWETLAEEEDAEVLESLADDLRRKADEMGAEALFEYLEDTLSGTIRIRDREAVLVDDYERTLDRLYRRHVASTVLEFRTHLPRYTLRAAAGRFLRNEDITEEDWVEAPEDLRLTKDLFVAEIAGHSMEPRIPDGSLCVFRLFGAGSRDGRLVLVEDRPRSAFSVKRYLSRKQVNSEDTWEHASIYLESLNPAEPSWYLDGTEDRYHVIAEFVRVLG